MPIDVLTKARDIIARREWVFAKTYADSFPHEYTKRRGHDPEYWWFRDFITSFGWIENFYQQARPYVIVEDWKYFHMSLDSDSVITNRTRPATKLYGTQWSARTRTSREVTEWDLLAPKWDRYHTPREGDLHATGELLESLVIGTVLDVGCGTGRLLDLLDIPPDRYIGVDPSGGMLNVHVTKRPHHYVEPVPLAEFQTATAIDTVTALFGSASLLTPSEIRQADELADETLILMFGPAEDDDAAYETAEGLVGIESTLYGPWRVLHRRHARSLF